MLDLVSNKNKAHLGKFEWTSIWSITWMTEGTTNTCKWTCLSLLTEACYIYILLLLKLNQPWNINKTSRDFKRFLLVIITVVTSCNDHLYNENFDFWRNFIGNGSYQNLLYYNGIRTIQHQPWFSAMNCFFLHIFYSLKRQKKKSSYKLFAINRYTHGRKWLTGA